MFTRDDLIDVIVGHLRGREPSKTPARAEPRGRPFLTEYDVKKRLTAGQTRLTLAKEAIISPLAMDWLILNGVTIVRE